jgi:hypothetical protein
MIPKSSNNNQNYSPSLTPVTFLFFVALEMTIPLNSCPVVRLIQIAHDHNQEASPCHDPGNPVPSCWIHHLRLLLPLNQVCVSGP